MTICVGCIYNKNSILGASDRMLTAGDVQFEPSERKIWPITSSIALMVAGDISLHTEICNRLIPHVNTRISSKPTEWINVSWVADLWSEIYYDLYKLRSEREILTPLGLTHETFLSRQHELLPDFVQNVRQRLNRFSLPDVGAIIAGNDTYPITLENNHGIPHLYVVNNGSITCNDRVGFAAIGSGYWHANSQFMFNRYTRTATESVALLNTYWAKKRAEVCPGVGQQTDMFVISPLLGSYQDIGENIIGDINKIYLVSKRNIERSNSRIEERVRTYLSHLGGGSKDQTPPTSPTIPSSGNK